MWASILIHPYKIGNLETARYTHAHTHTHRGTYGALHVKMKAEIGVILVQVKEPQRLPANH